MRAYLQEHLVEFDDRNIRKSKEARAELLALTDSLIVPLLVFQDQQVTGFDPDKLEEFVRSYFDTKQDR